jgi:Zn-dependent protease with chaperone function
MVGVFYVAVSLFWLPVLTVINFWHEWCSIKTPPPPIEWEFWNAARCVWTSLAALVVIGAGSAYRIWEFSDGGHVLAASLGGQPVGFQTDDPTERKLRNVVEEMAIAAGTPVPQVFVLSSEEGINAFAVGFTPEDAVVGVTRGALREFSRDELQAALGHVFSDIVNGDMRLNTQVAATFYGILFIGYFLKYVFTAALLIVFLFILAAPVLVTAYLGVFLVRIIKSAISRQRQFLADASAVQFTRNPLALAGALKKIGGFVAGSRVMVDSAEDLCHVFFANALPEGLLDMGLTETHPPLKDRIGRLDGKFDGKFEYVSSFRSTAETGKDIGTGVTGGPESPLDELRIEAGEILATVGTLTGDRLAHTRSMLSLIPTMLLEKARTPDSAQAVACVLLLNNEAPYRQRQMQHLRENAPEIYNNIQGVLGAVTCVDVQMKLPLAEIAIASLRSQGKEQRQVFFHSIQALIEADSDVDLFELAIQGIMKQRLGGNKAGAEKRRDLTAVAAECAGLLSCLAYWGSYDMMDQETAFAQGVEKLACSAPVQILASDVCNTRALGESLKVLSNATEEVRRRVLDACVACIAADGRVSSREAELLRCISAWLGFPMPPVLVP